MDMQLDGDKIKALRIQRAWSQDQLASAAGLSLRTIQRIERTGVAAGESAQALAAVFDTHPEALSSDLPDRSQPRLRFARPAGIGAGFVAGAFAGVLLFQGTTASALEYTVRSFLNDVPVAVRTERDVDGRPVTVSLMDAQSREQARVRIVATRLDSGNIRFDLVLFNCDQRGCLEAGTPAMETRLGEPTRVAWDKQSGEVVAYEITPTD